MDDQDRLGQPNQVAAISPGEGSGHDALLSCHLQRVHDVGAAARRGDPDGHVARLAERQDLARKQAVRADVSVASEMAAIG